MDDKELTQKSIVSHLDELVEEFPERPAVIHPTSSAVGATCEQFSFKELQHRSLSYALQLKEYGVMSGQRVLMMVPPGIDLLAGVYALFRLGAIPIFIDPGMKRPHLLACIKRSKPIHLFAISKAHWISRLFPSIFKTIEGRFCVGSKSVFTLAKRLSPVEKGGKVTDFNLPNQDDLAAILFTSGSTGPPKGVQYKVRHFLAQIDMLKRYFNIIPGHLDLPLLPVFSLFNPVLGMTSVIPRINPSKPSSLDPSHIIDLIDRFKIQHSFGAPVLWNILIDFCESRSLQLSSMEKVLMAGAPVPPDLLKRMTRITPNAVTLTPYGATEGLPLCVIDGKAILSKTAEMTKKGKGICVGNPLPGISIRILPISKPETDYSKLTDCLSEEIGEVVVSGSVVTDTYDALPEATKKSKFYVRDTLWHRMGDAGYLDDHGQLWFCGRVGHLVEYQGTPLFSDCVEAPFNEHPSLKRCALIKILRNGIELPALAIEIEDSKTIALSVIKAELLDIALKFNLPMIEDFYLHPSFPVDVRHNAKIHRIELGRWAQNRSPI